MVKSTSGIWNESEPLLQMSHALVKLVLVQIILSPFSPALWNILPPVTMCEYVGQGLKYEFRSKQQVGKVGTLSHSFFQCKIKSHWFTKTSNYGGSYRMEMCCSLPLLVQVALGKSPHRPRLHLVRCCANPRIVTFIILVTHEDCICLWASAEGGKGWRRRGGTGLLTFKDAWKLHERLPPVRAVDWSLVTWSQQGQDFEARVMGTGHSLLVKSNSFFLELKWFCWKFLKQGYLQHFSFWAWVS